MRHKRGKEVAVLAACKERGGGMVKRRGGGVNNKNKICLKSAMMKSNSL